MPKKESQQYARYLFFGVFVLVALLSFWIVRPFLGSIVVGIFICYIFYPVYQRMLSVVKNANVAAALMTVLVLLVIIVPLALLTQLIAVEVMGVYSKVNLQQAVSSITNYFNAGLQDVLAGITRQVLSFMASLLSAFVLSLPQKLLNVFVLVLSMFVSFRGGEKFVNNLRDVLPVGRAHKENFINRFKQVTDAIVLGVVLVSLVQGIAAMIAFYIFDVSSPALLGFLTFLAALLPVIGPAVVWVPVALFKYFSGDAAAAVGIMVYSIVVQNLLLDFMLKTRVIGAKGKISPLLVLLGIAGGVMAFGITGILLGPLVLVVLLEFLKVYVGKDAFAY